MKYGISGKCAKQPKCGRRLLGDFKDNLNSLLTGTSKKPKSKLADHPAGLQWEKQ